MPMRAGHVRVMTLHLPGLVGMAYVAPVPAPSTEWYTRDGATKLLQPTAEIWGLGFGTAAEEQGLQILILASGFGQ